MWCWLVLGGASRVERGEIRLPIGILFFWDYLVGFDYV